MNEKIKEQFGKEFLLIFVGYTSDASEMAKIITDLEPTLQRELDKLRKVNPNIPFSRIKMWKWDSDAISLKGGQGSVITETLGYERKDNKGSR